MVIHLVTVSIFCQDERSFNLICNMSQQVASRSRYAISNSCDSNIKFYRSRRVKNSKSKCEMCRWFKKSKSSLKVFNNLV